MSLIAHYPLNGTLEDYSINDNTASVIGTLSTVSNGKIGTAYKFENNSNGINIPNNQFLLHDFTMCAWICPLGTHLHYDGAIISSGDWNTKHWSFSIGQNNDSIKCRCPGNSIPYTFNLNTWYHLVYSRKGTTLSHYVNGDLISTYTSELYIPLVSNSSNNTTIGRETYAGGYFAFNGYIQDVRIYNHALSVNEVKELYKCKILHYDMNNDSSEPTVNLVSSASIATYTPYFTTTKITSEEYNFIAVNPLYLAIYDTKTTFDTINTYTVSGYAYLNNNPLKFASNNCNTYTTMLSYKTQDDGYFEYTYKFSESNQQWFFHIPLVNNNIAANDIITIKKFQLEAKDHATPFVNGTREGLISDCSGYNNHGVIESNNSLKHSNDTNIGSGCYEFDNIDLSTSDWILQLDQLLEPNNTSLTVSFWAYRDVNITINSNIVPIGWHLFIFTYDGTTITSYIDSILSNTVTGNSIHINDSTTNEGYYTAKISDFRVYASILSIDDIKSLYNVKTTLDKNNNLTCYDIKETSDVTTFSVPKTGVIAVNQIIENNNYKPTLVNYNNWNDLGTGSITSGITTWTYNGPINANKRVLYNNPWNLLDYVWECTYDSEDTNANGGFRLTNNITIDSTKKYRLSIWMKTITTDNTTPTGTLYLGFNTGTNSSGVSTNPYVWYEGTPVTYNEWKLIVGYIFPSSTTSTTIDPTAGRYKTDESFTNVGDFWKWNEGQTTATIRSFLCYCNNPNQKSYIYRPRFELADSAIPIRDLILGKDHVPLHSIDNCTEYAAITKTNKLILNSINIGL